MKCFAQEDNAVTELPSPAMARTLTTRSGDQLMKHQVTAHPHKWLSHQQILLSEVRCISSKAFSKNIVMIGIIWSTVPSLTWPTSLSNGCSNGQSVSRSVDCGIGSAVCRSVGLSVCRSVGLSVSRSLGLSVGQSVSQSV